MFHQMEIASIGKLFTCKMYSYYKIIVFRAVLRALMGYEQLAFTEEERQQQRLRVLALRRYIARQQYQAYQRMNYAQRALHDANIEMPLIKRGVNTFDRYARFMFDANPTGNPLAYADIIHEGGRLAMSLNRTLVVEAPGPLDDAGNPTSQNAFIMTPEGQTIVLTYKIISYMFFNFVFF
jgi:hypothetical protein